MTEIEYAVTRTPVGPVGVAWRGDVVVLAEMDVAASRTEWSTDYARGGPHARMRERLSLRFADVHLVRGAAGAAPLRALRRYFEGEVDALDSLETDPGGTAFQAAVWRELRRIPAGHTRTYGELAEGIGHPGAARATGGAVGANPIPLVIPCHRILGGDGKLTGFGGGIRRKHWLLSHEGAAFREPSRQLSFA